MKMQNAERRTQNQELQLGFPLFVLISSFCALRFFSGCSPSATTQPSVAQRQDEALKDPMGYKVPPNPSVTDGDITSFDKKGFQKDVDDVLNP